MTRRSSRGRPVRARRAKGRSRVGERFEAVVGPVAHGGSCVVRLPAPVETVAARPPQEPPDTRVVFVRHTLPGERVVLRITEGNDGDRFWRGDAVEVLEPSPDRVAAPCPAAGPGGCGGCDLQHVSAAAQRALKATVVAEQLRRLAGIEWDVEVEALPVPGTDDPLLRWRTRQRYAVLPDGRRAMRKHRSHDLVPVDDCLIATTDAIDPDTATGTVTERVAPDGLGERHFEVEASGFWQVHPASPSVLTSAVLDLLAPRHGERVLDLYSGVGLFSRFLVDAVGPSGRVVAVEGDSRACDHAAVNVPEAEIVCGSVAAVLATSYAEPFDLVVLDPPRTGAKRAVVEAVAARRPRAVAYVACDPAALARDVAIFAEQRYELTQLRAFDLFPMTHHVECVALLTKTSSDLR